VIKTVVTKKEIEGQFGQVADLGQLMKALEQEFSKKGQVICQFKLNGMSLTEADEQRLANIGLGEVEIIEIDSESPDALMFGLLDNWTLELPKLIENAEALAKSIKFEGIEGKLKAFVELLDTCQFLMDSLMSLERVVTDFQSRQIQSPIGLEPWLLAEKVTADAIGEALKAFEKKDFVLLAEVLEYDLPHSLQVWLDQILQLNYSLRAESQK
jgi:hypothetical protein